MTANKQKTKNTQQFYCIACDTYVKPTIATRAFKWGLLQLIICTCDKLITKIKHYKEIVY